MVARHGRRPRPRRRPDTCPAGRPRRGGPRPGGHASPARRRTPSAPPRPRTPARSPAPAPPSPALVAAPAGCRVAPCAVASRAPRPGPPAPPRAAPRHPARHRPRRRDRPPVVRRPAAAAWAACSTAARSSAAGHGPAADRRRRLHLGGAAVGANNAAGYQLASEEPVMAIGGFNGSDPSPTLAQFEEYVANGQIHWFIASGGRAVAPAATEQRDRRSGSRPTSPPRPSTARPSTTSPAGSSERAGAACRARWQLRPTGPSTTVLDVVIPVYNEEDQLAASVERVLAHLRTLPWTFQVTVADNASTDQTALIARRLSHTHPEVSVVHLAEKGRGRALKRVWSASESDVLVYMDVDLSTDLAALLPLVAPLVSGHSDLAIGSRLSPSLACRARGQAGVHLAELQPAPASGAASPVQRRPVRVQGDPQGRRARAAPAGGGQRVVLRHRAPGGCRTRRPADPRGSGRLDRRP